MKITHLTTLKHKLQWLMLLAALLGVSSTASAFKVYLKPSSSWKSDGARFAVYFFGSGDGWTNMTEIGSTGYYYADVNDKYTTIIFCRMNGSQIGNNWDNRYNQSGDISKTDASGNVYKDDATGNWNSCSKSGTVGDITGDAEIEENTDGSYSVTSGGSSYSWNSTNTTNVSVKSGGSTASATLKGGSTAGGSADIFVTYTKNSKYYVHYKNITVIAGCTTPTKSQYTMASGQSVTYDGSAHAPSITVNNSAGSVAKIYGSTDGGSTWTDYGTAGPINAGTYNIKVDVNAGGDYCAASGIVLDNTYAITKKTPTASDFDFSNQAQTLPTTIVAVGVTPKSGISGMGSVSQIYYAGSTTLPTTAGTYAVTFNIAAGTNYSAATGLSAGNLVISKSNQTTPTVNNLDSHCGTGDYTLSASDGESTGYYNYAIVSDETTGTATIVNNETATVTLRVTAVGNIIVKAKKLGDANYNESAYSANKTFTIKANSTASQYTIASGHNMDYTGSALTPTITKASGAGDISKYYYSSDNGSTWTAGTPTNAGTYKIKVDVAEGTSYCATNGIVITNTFTINKIDQPHAVTIDNETTSYCVSTLGTNIPLEASGGDGTGAYSFTITGGTVAADKRSIISGSSTLTVSGAGTVILQATRVADTNYNAKNSGTVTFTFTANGPKVFTLTNEGATALCGKGDGSSTGTGGSLRLTGSESGYSYQLKKDDANYGVPVAGTGSALTFPVTSSGVYTCMAYYGDDPSQCPTEMYVEDGGIVLVVNITPRLLPGTPTVRQYQAVTITSTNTEIDKWVLSGEGADAYTYDSTPNSITLKANTAGSPYRLIATTSAGCTATAVITVIADTENCVP